MNNETVKIQTLKDNNRMSTQELLQYITSKLKEGYTNFDIDASGQHNIGGSSWAKDKISELTFTVRNPGQRVGAMALKGTKIIVEGSAPADVGWLNSGAKIIVKGDCGDTAAHCAAGGKIYAAGRVGTRSGALMKHDPKFDVPEFWVLKNTGSFGFEFMGGGTAIVCGWDCEGLSSVLGSRSCVGMVGGTIYVRGPIQDIAECVEIKTLDDNDIKFLSNGLVEFLKEIDKSDILEHLSVWSEWKKIIPLAGNIHKTRISVSEFRKNNWIENGIFGDFIHDDLVVYPMPSTGEGRVHIPKWDGRNCIDCKICLNNCPESAIQTKEKKYYSEDEKCIGCGICEAVCPKKCWNIISDRKEIS